MQAPTPTFDRIGAIDEHGAALVDLVAATDPSTPITSCPGWVAQDLAAHVVECWSFWAQVATRRLRESADVAQITTPDVDQGSPIADLLGAAHRALCDALGSASEGQPVWSWAGPGLTVAWLRRRMVHETTVHRWDLESALGTGFDIPADIATDGIDEFLMHHAAHQPAADARELGGSLHLHCTDTVGEWFIERMDPGRCTFRREHRRGDAAVRGRAHHLELWLWGRAPVDSPDLEFFGDLAVARRFRGFGDLDF